MIIFLNFFNQTIHAYLLKNNLISKFEKHQKKEIVEKFDKTEIDFSKMEPTMVTDASNYDTLVAEADDINEVVEMIQDTFSKPADSDNMIFNKDYYTPKIVYIYNIKIS